jgi:xanthine dehydrogenase accessory factor
MNSVDIEVLRTAVDWLNSGRRVIMGTVVRTWGSAPRPPGSLMIMRDDGQVAGSVSGGCVEDDLIRRLYTRDLPVDRPAVTSYGGNAEEARRFGLPCGGTVEIVLEPLNEQSRLGELLAQIEAHRSVERTLDLETGKVTLRAAREGDTLAFDGRRLHTVHGPKQRLLIIGAGQVARYLAAMAVMLDYLVTVCDPREEYLQAWQPMEGVLLSDDMPDEIADAMQLDASSAVVAATHDPKLDDLALVQALGSPAFYVGALGSRHNNDRRRQRLEEFVGAAGVARLRGPVGLNLGGLTPSEIALSIMAEMTALRRGCDVNGNLANWDDSTTVCAVGEE